MLSMSSEDLRNLITSGKKTKFAKAMAEILEDKKNKFPEFYEFYGELIKDHTNFTLSKCYYQFRRYAQKILSLQQLLQMDKVLMQNYALSKLEPIRFCFLGQVFRTAATWGSNIWGVIYITKFRVIGLGVYTQSSGARAIAKAISSSISDTSHKAFRYTMQKIMGDDFTEAELTKFDHYYPIINPYKIEKKNKLVQYKIPLEYEKQENKKTKKLWFKIVPFKEKNEDKFAFEKRKEELLDRINSFLISCQ